MIDAPDGTEQADERRRAANRCQQHLAELQLRQHHVQRAAQPARQLRIERPLAFEHVGIGTRDDGGDQRLQHVLLVQPRQLLAAGVERR